MNRNWTALSPPGKKTTKRAVRRAFNMDNNGMELNVSLKITLNCAFSLNAALQRALWSLCNPKFRGPEVTVAQLSVWTILNGSTRQRFCPTGLAESPPPRTLKYRCISKVYI